MDSSKKRKERPNHTMPLSMFMVAPTPEIDAVENEILMLVSQYEDDDLASSSSSHHEETICNVQNLSSEENVREYTDSLEPVTKKLYRQGTDVEPQTQPHTSADNVHSIGDIVSFLQKTPNLTPKSRASLWYIEQIKRLESEFIDTCSRDRLNAAATPQLTPSTTHTTTNLHMSRMIQHLRNVVISNAALPLISEHHLLVCLLAKSCIVTNFRNFIRYLSGTCGKPESVTSGCLEILKSRDPAMCASSSLSSLNKSKSTHAIFWLHGPGSVGKTSLFTNMWSRHVIGMSKNRHENIIVLKPESLSSISVSSIMDFYHSAITHILRRSKASVLRAKNGAENQEYHSDMSETEKVDSWMKLLPQRGMVPILLSNLDYAFDIVKCLDLKTERSAHVKSSKPNMHQQNSDRLLSEMSRLLLSFGGLVDSAHDVSSDLFSRGFQPVIYISSSSKNNHHFRALTRALFRLPRDDPNVNSSLLPPTTRPHQTMTRPLLSQRIIVIPQPTWMDMTNAIFHCVEEHFMITLVENINLRYARRGLPSPIPSSTLMLELSRNIQDTSSALWEKTIPLLWTFDAVDTIIVTQSVIVSSSTRSACSSWCGEGRYLNLARLVKSMVKLRVKIALSNPSTSEYSSSKDELLRHAAALHDKNSDQAKNGLRPFDNTTPNNLFALADARACIFLSLSTSPPAISSNILDVPHSDDHRAPGMDQYDTVFAEASISCIQPNDAIALCLYPSVYGASRKTHARFLATMVARHGMPSLMNQLDHNINHAPNSIRLSKNSSSVYISPDEKIKNPSIAAILALTVDDNFDKEYTSVTSSANKSTIPEPFANLEQISKLSLIISKSLHKGALSAVVPSIANAIWMSSVVHGRAHLEQCRSSISWFHTDDVS